MADVFDVAEYILEQAGPMSTWKLQKLVYYSQAWSLVWDNERLFDDEIQAWANGPVVPALYKAHRGRFQIGAHQLGRGDSSHLRDYERETINAVIHFYGDKSAQWLRDLTHAEAPWIAAREGLAPGDRGKRAVSTDLMGEYYGSL